MSFAWSPWVNIPDQSLGHKAKMGIRRSNLNTFQQVVLQHTGGCLACMYSIVDNLVSSCRIGSFLTGFYPPKDFLLCPGDVCIWDGTQDRDVPESSRIYVTLLSISSIFSLPYNDLINYQLPRFILEGQEDPQHPSGLLPKSTARQPGCSSGTNTTMGGHSPSSPSHPCVCVCHKP